MKFVNLFSGSKGNLSVVFTEDTMILIDCGVPYCTAKKALAEFGLDADNADAVLVTHEHADHVAGLTKLLENNTKARVFVHEKGREALIAKLETADRVGAFSTPFSIGGLTVDFYVCSHDSAFCCGFKLTDQKGKSVAIVTDTGEVNDEFFKFVEGCDMLMLESNYDETMLLSGKYPYLLKRRIASECGHLSNRQACDLLVKLAPTTLRTVILAHLSEENNSAEMAFAAAVTRLNECGFREGRELRVLVAKQHSPCEVVDTDD